MFGVLVNVGTVVLGALAGLLFKKGIPEKVSKAAMIGLGVCTLYIGISGSLEGENVLLVIASVVLGAIVGTLLDIDGKINILGQKVEKKFKKGGNTTSVAEGWVTATLLFCVGSMTVTGSIAAGLTGDHSILVTKAMLDLVSAMMIIILSPILFWFQKDKKHFYTTCLSVAMGKRSWVGYCQKDNENSLPRIKKGIFSPKDMAKKSSLIYFPNLFRDY